MIAPPPKTPGSSDPSPQPPQRSLRALSQGKIALDFQLAAAEQRVAVQIPQYLRLTKDPPAIQSAVADFLAAAIRDARRGPRAQQTAAAARIIALGSRDPFVYFHYARRLERQWRKQRARKAYQSGYERLTDAHPPWLRAHLTLSALEDLAQRGREDSAVWRRTRRKAFEALLDWMRSPDCIDVEADDAAWVAEQLTSDLDCERLQKSYGRALEKGFPSPWLTHLSRGRFEIQVAWWHRGSGWANTVSDQAWQGFFRHLKKAEIELTQALRIAPAYSAPATEMITVAMGRDGVSAARHWFERAVERQFDDHGAYRRMLHALLPRWGGSIERMFEFAVECFECGRHDTWAPEFGLTALDEIAADTEPPPSIWRVASRLWQSFRGRYEMPPASPIWQEPAILECVMNGLGTRIAAREQTPGSDALYPLDALRSLCAGAAARLENWPVVRSQLDALGPRLDANMLYRFDVEADAIDQQAWTGVAAQPALFNEARSCESKRKYAQAVAKYREALASESNDVLRKHLSHCVGRCELQQAMLEGAWIDLPFSPELRGWSMLSGEAQVESPRAIRLTSQGRRPPVLMLDATPGERFILEADVEIAGPVAAASAFGVFIGQWEKRKPIGGTLWFDPARGLGGMDGKQNLLVTPAAITNPCRLRVEAYDGNVVFVVNDDAFAYRTIDDCDPLWKRPGIHFAPLVRGRRFVAAGVRIANVRLRRNTYPVLLPTVSVAKRLKQMQAWHQRDGEDLSVAVRYASCLLEQASVAAAKGSASAAERDRAAAKQIIEAQLAKAPQSPRLRTLHVAALFDSGQDQAALAELARLRADLPRFICPIYVALGWHEKRGDRAASLALLDEYLAVHPFEDFLELRRQWREEQASD